MQEKPVVFIQRYVTPCGELVLGSLGDKLCLCDWIVERHRERVDRRLRTELGCIFVESESEVIREAARQLDEYFVRKRTVFTVPLLFVGSDFQQRVWRQLQNISYGETVSYAEVARRIGQPTAVRAVANANGANAISIFVPCHRVIGSNRTLTGYGGGLDTKRFLLDLERESLFR